MVQSKHQLPQLTHRRTVDCTNCVVIMTSNLGSEHLMAMAGDAGRHGPALEKARSMVLQTIRRSLRPELLNRLDDVIVFSPLSGDVLRQVVRLQLADVVRRLDELEVTMHITDAAVDRVLKAAHDPEMGAPAIEALHGAASGFTSQHPSPGRQAASWKFRHHRLEGHRWQRRLGI